MVTKAYGDKSWNGRPSKSNSLAERESLLQWILSQNKPLTIPEIAELTGIDGKRLNIWLPWLWRHGKIGRILAERRRKFFFGPQEVIERVSIDELDLPATTRRKEEENDFEHSTGGLKGELGLLAAVLVNARKQLLHLKNKGKKRKTLEWFTCGEDESIFSFSVICEYMGLSKKKVLQKIIKEAQGKHVTKSKS